MKINKLIKCKSLKGAQELKPVERNKIIQETKTEVITKPEEKGKHPKNKLLSAVSTASKAVQLKKAGQKVVGMSKRDAEDHCLLEQWG